MRDDAWFNRRKALHRRYADVAQIGDASRLGFIHASPRTWTEEEIADLWRTAATRPPSGRLQALNNVYVHVPFCKSICDFCNYDRLQPSSPELLKNWLARVRRSLDVIGPAVRPLTFHTLFIGGGTPSVLPARMLEELLTALDTALRWDRLAERRFEFDPSVMSRERLEVLKRHGFRQLSFGLETLDAEVNARHNRGRQGMDVIDRCFANLRALHLTDVACDFLLGLDGTTPEQMLGEIETVLQRYAPKRVDMYMLTPTHAYVKQHFAGSWDACWAHIRGFEKAVPPALPALAERTGYSILNGSGHHLMLENRRLRSLRELFEPDLATIFERWRRKLAGTAFRMIYNPLTSEAHRPVNVLALGRSARSVIFGAATFSSRDPQDNPAVEGPADYSGDEMDLAAEACSFLAHVLRDVDTVDRSEFRAIFGHDMDDLIGEAIAAWTREGTATVDEKALRLVRQDRQERIRSLLWLVPEEALEFDLGHFDQLDLSPGGVARLAGEIQRGSPLGDGHSFEGVDGTRVLVGTPEGGRLRLRIAPELNEGEPLRLVPDDGEVPSGPVHRLEGMLTTAHRRLVRHTQHPPAHSLPIATAG
jgi:coproporphyrinogen III oxidase-like Fe-S oxidoreductase